jgi:hypothetical protein
MFWNRRRDADARTIAALRRENENLILDALSRADMMKLQREQIAANRAHAEALQNLASQQNAAMERMAACLEAMEQRSRGAGR